jgi:hypothetical protein
MVDKGCEGFPIGELPGPWEGHDGPIAQLLDQGQVGSGGISGIGHHHDLLTPGRPLEVFEHLPKQGVFGLVVGSLFAPKESEVHRDAVAVLRRHEDDAPQAIEVRMMLTEARVLSDWRLLPPRGLEGAVAH